MSVNRRTNRTGFTLVEILIVVIILGILAAIVIPQFTNASQNARESSLQSTLQTLRSQIQLYKLQHGDQLPDLAGSNTGSQASATAWTEFTSTTTYGNPAQTFGPYMQAIPTNSINGNSTVVNVTGEDGTIVAGSACGFAYDYNSGNGSGRIYGTDSTGTNIAGTGTFGASGFAAY